MEITVEDTLVIQKTKELCQTILEQPNLKAIRQHIDNFMADEKTRSQYEDLVNRGQALQEKQQNAVQLSGEEVADFEQRREALFQNPVARGFIDAQEELHEIKQSIHSMVNKTLELGRLPTEEELNGGCGHGCGCSH